MPRKFLMSFEPHPAYRWKKEYKKKVYRVTCKELDLPPAKWTELESYQAANDWWIGKKNELDGIEVSTHPHAKTISKIDQRIDIAKKLGLTVESAYLETLRADAKDATADEADWLKEVVKDHYFFNREEVWNERKRLVQPAPASETCQYFSEQFLETNKDNAKTGMISTARYSAIDTALKSFVAFYGPSRSLKTINEQDVRAYNKSLKERYLKGGKGNSADYIWSQWQVFKQFMRFTSEQFPDFVVPKNLKAKEFGFDREGKEPDPFTKDELHLILNNSTERYELYYLLMVNVGMTQIDVAELQADQVDWEAGRIIRARSKKKKIMKNKGKKDAKIIKINWLLWDRTFELLKKFGNREGTVLLNVDGGVICGWRLGEKPTRIDSIHTAHERLKTKLKKENLVPKNWSKPVKTCRQTGPNILQDSDDFVEFIDVFLDHSSVAKKNYLKSGKPVPRFDAAVKFVGEQLGFSTTRA